MLQTRGRVTAAEVAAELEISERTARRDLDALGMAGPPRLHPAGPRRRVGAGRRRPHRPERPHAAGGPGPVPGRRPVVGGDARDQGRAAQAGPGAARDVPRGGRGRVGGGGRRPDELGRRPGGRPAAAAARTGAAGGRRSASGAPRLPRATGQRHTASCTRSGSRRRAPPGTWSPTPRPASGRSASTA